MTLLASTPQDSATAGPGHPLEPLAPAEFTAAAAVLRFPGFFDGNPMLALPAEGGHCAPTVAGGAEGGCGEGCPCGH